MAPRKKRPAETKRKTDRPTPRRAEQEAAGPARKARSDRPGQPGYAKGLLRSPVRATLVVFLFSFALYANTIGHSFVWDDFHLIVKNEAIRTLDLKTVKDAFTLEFMQVPHREGEYYRPLTTLSYHVNFKLTGDKPWGFHLANVLMNSLVCVLAFLFVSILFRNTGIGLVCALLFAAHPTHTENVAWVAGRTDLIATFWILVSLICYVLYRQRRRVLLIGASLAAFFFALLSKESSACLPLIVGLIELGPFRFPSARPPRTDRGGQKDRMWFIRVVLFLFVLALFLIVRWRAIGTLTSEHPPIAPSASGNIALPFSILAGYMLKVFFPFRLSGEYDAPVPASFAHPHVVAGIVLFALLIWGVWRFRRLPAVVLGAGVFVFGLSPVLNIVPIGEVSADRFLYLPSLGVALVLGWVFSSALFHRRPAFGSPADDPNHLAISHSLARGLRFLFVIVMLVFAGRTVARNREWKNNDVFFTATVAEAPGSPRAHLHFGNVAREKGDIPTAVREYKTVLRLKPDDTEAMSNLAGIYTQQEKYDDAIPLMERALEIWSDNAPLNRNLGCLYLTKREYAKAEKWLNKALAMDPGDVRTHYFLGLVDVERRDFPAARRHFERAAEGGPELHMSYYYLAVIEKETGNENRAKQYAQRFLAGYSTDDEFRKTAQAIVSSE